MIRFHHSREGSRGLTVVELVVVFAIVTFVGTAALTFMRDVFVMNAAISDGFFANHEMRRALRVMTAELRTLSASETGAYPIETAGTSTLSFFSDADGDGVKERIRYYITSNELRRSMLAPTGTPPVYTGVETETTLVHNLTLGTSSLFTYYDQEYSGTTSPLTVPVDVSLIRLVRIDVRADRDVNRPPPVQSLTTHVMLRNLKTNYED